MSAILNGFWSKELILEAGIAHAPVWSIFMFIGAGLTALYTLRMVWLVFFGEQRDPLHGHDAGPAMKVALYPLAIGALILVRGMLRRFSSPASRSIQTLCDAQPSADTSK